MKKHTIMKYYIYSLKSPITNEVVYIGKTKNPEKRLKDHHRIENRIRCRLDRWKLLMSEIGLKANMEILLECNENEVNDRERHFIKIFKENGYNLLNMTDGGDGLQNPSTEVRKKIGEKSKGRIKTEKTRLKLSKSNYNRSSSKSILCYDIEGRLIGKFINARRASESLNIDYKLISNTALNNQSFVNGKYTFFFELEEDIEYKLTERIEKTTKIGSTFYRIDKFGFKKIYNNIMDADREMNISFKNIWLCLNKKRKTAGGYAWVYENEFNGEFDFFFEKKSKGFKVRAKSHISELYFSSLTEAAKNFKIKTSTLKKYIDKNQSKNGFYFEFYN